MRNRSLFNARTLVLGGLAVAVAATALKNRQKVAGLIGVRSSEPEPYVPPATATPGQRAAEHFQPAPTPPTPSNFDAPGPPSNTATHVPAPDPVVTEAGIDEEAEEAAAAAEAAAIGGATPDYAGANLDEEAGEETRPLMEAGEGEAEGQEQSEALLADNAESSSGDTVEAERQIDEVIEQQDNPFAGEVVEPLHPPEDGGEADREGTAPTPLPGQMSIDADADDEPTLSPETLEGGAATTGGTLGGTTGATPAAEKSSAVWRSEQEEEEQPTAEEPVIQRPTTDEDDGSEWQTWSGRAVDR